MVNLVQAAQKQNQKTNLKTNLFEGYKIRSVWDDTSKKHWFSVVDVCAALCNKEYGVARNYWKWLKNKLMAQQNELVSTTNQLKLLAADGKYRYTDVMDLDEILCLIQLCPSPNAEKFRLWIADMLVDGVDVVKKLKDVIVGVAKAFRETLGVPVCVMGLLRSVRVREVFLGSCDLGGGGYRAVG